MKSAGKLNVLCVGSMLVFLIYTNIFKSVRELGKGEVKAVF